MRGSDETRRSTHDVSSIELQSHELDTRFTFKKFNTNNYTVWCESKIETGLSTRLEGKLIPNISVTFQHFCNFYKWSLPTSFSNKYTHTRSYAYTNNPSLCFFAIKKNNNQIYSCYRAIITEQTNKIPIRLPALATRAYFWLSSFSSCLNVSFFFVCLHLYENHKNFYYYFQLERVSVSSFYSFVRLLVFTITFYPLLFRELAMWMG